MQAILNNHEPFLSALETDILEMMAQGLSNYEIAEVLCMDTPTIEFYKKRMVANMQMPGINALLAHILRQGFYIKKYPLIKMVA